VTCCSCHMIAGERVLDRHWLMCWRDEHIRHETAVTDRSSYRMTRLEMALGRIRGGIIATASRHTASVTLSVTMVLILQINPRNLCWLILILWLMVHHLTSTHIHVLFVIALVDWVMLVPIAPSPLPVSIQGTSKTLRIFEGAFTTDFIPSTDRALRRRAS
jgi:hypothetical protein